MHVGSSQRVLKSNQGVDVTDIVQSLVSVDRLELYVDNAIFGDSAPGKSKELVVTYMKQAKEVTAVAAELGRMNLSGMDPTPEPARGYQWWLDPWASRMHLRDSPAPWLQIRVNKGRNLTGRDVYGIGRLPLSKPMVEVRVGLLGWTLHDKRWDVKRTPIAEREYPLLSPKAAKAVAKVEAKQEKRSKSAIEQPVSTPMPGGAGADASPPPSPSLPASLTPTSPSHAPKVPKRKPTARANVTWNSVLHFPLHRAFLHETVILVLIVDGGADKPKPPPEPAAPAAMGATKLAGQAGSSADKKRKAAAVATPTKTAAPVSPLYEEEAICSGARIDLSKPLKQTAKLRKDSGNARYSISKELLANARRVYPRCGDYLACETLLMSTEIEPKAVALGSDQATMANGSLSIGCAVTYQDMEGAAAAAAAQ
jgi:hypothetical protein